jgi:hypothetical protein
MKGDVMVTEKDLFIAVLGEKMNKNLSLKILAICLVACLAMLPTTALSQIPSNVYNPLADINEDGKVNLQDLVLLAEAYGTNGTPINTTELENQVTALQTQVGQLLNDFSLYNNEFGSASLVVPSLNFSPPVSMYYALRIALESDGWNESSLSNMRVFVSLEYMEFWSNSSSSGSLALHDMTQPAKDYTPVQVNSTTYRYIWDIVVESNVGLEIPPPGLYWVDAATGEIVPHGPLL